MKQTTLSPPLTTLGTVNGNGNINGNGNGTSTTTTPPPPNKNRPRKRPDLCLPLPQRLQPKPLAVPLPLPPPPADAAATTTTADAAAVNPQNQDTISFTELDRISRIGGGSGGTVYKVVHRRTGRLYALKVIHGDQDDAVGREMQILCGVDHPNVVRCHAMESRHGEIQVLLELMDCGSLEGFRIPNESNLSLLTFQILSGIAYLHRKKIVHRDIKPSNLLINSRNVIKIADFGVGRILDQTVDPCNSSVGTIAYMSPERINTDLNNGVYDGFAGDIWSLGVSVLEFYLGRFPFSVTRQGDWASLMCAICMSQPPEAPPTASREFRDFIRCCLQREPGKRWTATQLLQHPFMSMRAGGGGSGSVVVVTGREGGSHRSLHQLLPPPRQQTL